MARLSKLLKTIALSSIFIAGCGHENSNSLPTQAKTSLPAQNQQINQKISFNYENTNIKFDHIDWSEGFLYWRKQELQDYETNPSVKIPFDKIKPSLLELSISEPQQNKVGVLRIDPIKREVTFKSYIGQYQSLTY